MIKGITLTLGVFILSIILFAIPILTTCAFTFNWIVGIKYILTMLSLIDLTAIGTFIAREVNADEDSD
ncbi:MAG: hypothetical protein IIY21_11320 [Clostridiales bacterium]|nr:hypothetical protein [Clostridiales bacterium]